MGRQVGQEPSVPPMGPQLPFSVPLQEKKVRTALKDQFPLSPSSPPADQQVKSEVLTQEKGMPECPPHACLVSEDVLPILAFILASPWLLSSHQMAPGPVFSICFILYKIIVPETALRSKQLE